MLDRVTISDACPDGTSGPKLGSCVLGTMSIEASSVGVSSRYDGLGLLPVEKLGEAGGVKLNMLGGKAI